MSGLKSSAVIRKSYSTPRLGQSSNANDILIEKILNTDETFLFTYRGNPTHKHINEYLEKNGIDYKLVSNDRPHVSRSHFRCFKTWQNFLNDKVSKRQIMDYWPLMGKLVKAHGKGSVETLKKDLIDLITFQILTYYMFQIYLTFQHHRQIIPRL